MRETVLVVAVMVGIAAVGGCGGTSTPASPTPTGAGGGATVSISMLGNDDSSFLPSPADAPRGSVVVWRNADDTPHRVVATDGSFDTGVVAPGASSVPIVMPTDGANYYCAIHPAELGSINSSSGFPPPCKGPHCG